MKLTEAYLQTWTEARTRFTNQLNAILEADLGKKIGSSPNSAGFILRHIADVELLFAKNVFGKADVKVLAKSLISGKDTGEWTNLHELIDYQHQAANELKAAIEMQNDENWHETISTKEFGTRTKAEAIGRIISHTAYHAGQLALILKYGN
ncbi:MAG: DinB family protein [Bacteroidia bacterium]